MRGFWGERRDGGFGGIAVVQVLLDLAADRAGIDDCAFDGAQQSVRERGQSGRGGRMRLHPAAPRAQQEPQDGQRQPRDALRAECRHAAEHGDQRQRDEHQAGPQPDPMSGCNAGGKEPCGMKERNRAQTGGGGTVESLRGGGWFGLHAPES